MPDQQLPPLSVTVTPPEPGVTIGLREIYETSLATKTEVGSLRTDLARVLSTDADHEQRLRELKDAQSNYVTKAAARWWFTAVIGLVVAAAAVVGLLIR